MKGRSIFVESFVGNETEELLVGHEIRDEGAWVFGACTEMRFDPQSPDGVSLMIQQAEDVVSLRVDLLQKDLHLCGVLQANRLFLVSCRRSQLIVIE